MKERLIEILDIAIRYRVSDIHFEMKKTDERQMLRIEMRVKGIMEQLKPKKGDEKLFHYLAYRANLDVSAHGRPQSGAFTEKVNGTSLSLRYHIMPSAVNVSGVLRILDLSTKMTIESLSQDPRVHAWMHHVMSLHDGLVVLSGATGSGKTTSLYTMLESVSGKKIVTLEDPIEIFHEGFMQVQVNEDRNLSYAQGIREFMRQDPDIIMIGEIRDGETAKIAVQASITGHLVVSTLHTNSTAGAIVRLMDMGVENYLLADSVFGVIAQRLVRTLGPECKKERPVSEQDRKDLGVGPFEEVHLYEPCGCEKCGRTGYTGRVGVYEILRVTPRIRELIHNQASADELRRVAIDEGMLTLHHNARQHVLNGVTTLNEMLRITYEND